MDSGRALRKNALPQGEGLRRGGACCGVCVGFDQLAGGILAATAATGDWQVSLHLIQGRCASIHDFADLPVANAMA
jgi:hypothetical protein